MGTLDADGVEFTTIVFVGLSLLWGGRRGFGAAPALDDRLLAMLVVQFCVWTSGSLVPLGVAWVASELIWHPFHNREDRRGDVGESGDFGEDRAGLLVGWSDSPAARFVVTAAVVGLAIVTASSRPPGNGGRFHEGGARGGLFATFGWGIDSRLDPRHMELALSESNFRTETGSRTVFADDVRSAGMVAWLLGPAGPSGSAEGVAVTHRGVWEGQRGIVAGPGPSGTGGVRGVGWRTTIG